MLTVLVSGFELENLAAGIALDLHKLPDAAAGTFLGGTTFLALGVAGALPCNERPTVSEQGRRVLDQDGQRGQGTRGHEVVRPASLGGAPLLGPSRNGAGAGEPRRGSEPLDHLSLPARRLDQVYARARKRCSEHEAGETRS